MQNPHLSFSELSWFGASGVHFKAIQSWQSPCKLLKPKAAGPTDSGNFYLSEVPDVFNNVRDVFLNHSWLCAAVTRTPGF